MEGDKSTNQPLKEHKFATLQQQTEITVIRGGKYFCCNFINKLKNVNVADKGTVIAYILQ